MAATRLLLGMGASPELPAVLGNRHVGFFSGVPVGVPEWQWLEKKSPRGRSVGCKIFPSVPVIPCPLPSSSLSLSAGAAFTVERAPTHLLLSDGGE